MKRTLEGKNVVVTGGFGLLGSAIAEAIEQAGGTAIRTTRDPAKAHSFNERASTSRRAPTGRVLRFLSETEVSQVLQEVAETFGSLDGLVNNAGFVSKTSQPVNEVTWETWSDAIVANVGHAHSCAVAAVETRQQNRVRSIVNVGSIYATVAPEFRIYPPEKDPSAIYYGATKAALLQMTRYLASYWAPLGVRVNAVSPGGIANNQTDPFRSNYISRVPLGRLSMSEEVASVACFLLSDESSFVTGQNLVVDGGQTIW